MTPVTETTAQQVWVIVAAAGGSLRFGGGVSKQYRLLGDQPLLLRTLSRLASHPRVAGLVVVLHRSDELWPGLETCEGKPVITTVGGSERWLSVRNGLEVLPDSVGDHDWVLVHDAARPCVRHEHITGLLEKGWEHPVGAVLGVPVRDTLKTVDAAHTVRGTLDRDQIWHAQTPQMFRRSALSRALANGGPVNDEAAAMEALGKLPMFVEGSPDNLKVTFPDDLALAEYYLDRQTRE